MADSVKVRHIKGGFSSTDSVVLHKTAKTRLIFFPNIHADGVRGCLVRQKIGVDGKWEHPKKIDFRKVPADFCAVLELKTEATQKLFNHLENLYKIKDKGTLGTNKEFVVEEKSKVLIIDDANKQKVIQQIISKGYSEELWRSLLKDKPDLATRLAIAKIQSEKQVVIKKLERSLTQHSGDEEYWQEFFENDPWVLEAALPSSIFMLNGKTYLGGKQAKSDRGVGGVATDFLFADESTKSFVVVEIKTPKSKLVGFIYRGKKESNYSNEIYSMSPELLGGIVQVQNQLQLAIENFQSTLGKTFDKQINCIHPRAVLITGESSKLGDAKRNSFNQFRRGLHSPLIITFDELLRRLQGLYVSNLKSKDSNFISNSGISPDDLPF